MCVKIYGFCVINCRIDVLVKLFLFQNVVCLTTFGIGYSFIFCVGLDNSSSSKGLLWFIIIEKSLRWPIVLMRVR